MHKLIFLVCFIVFISIDLLLAGGVGPPPSPQAIPLDGGMSAVMVAVGAYIGYKALKKDEE